jgi:hypothetical protein
MITDHCLPMFLTFDLNLLTFARYIKTKVFCRQIFLVLICPAQAFGRSAYTRVYTVVHKMFLSLGVILT